MIKIYRSGESTPVAICDLKPPRGVFYVVRASEGDGGYRRLKFTVVEHDGERGLATDDLAMATYLPGFQVIVPDLVVLPPVPVTRPVAGKPGLASTVRASSQPGHEERRGRKTPSLAKSPGDAMNLEAQVLARILRKLAEIPLTMTASCLLPAGEAVTLSLPLPTLPEGRLLLLPAPDLPVTLPVVLGRVDLGDNHGLARIPLLAAQDMTLPAGMVLGRLEVRSPSELPEGMREKVFRSHFESRIAEARTCASP